MNLLPQDVLVMIKLVLKGATGWSYEGLAHELGMSASMAHSAVRRATHARLYDPVLRRPRKTELQEFLVHGVKYAYPPDLGTVTRGVPTAHAAAPLAALLPSDDAERHVWPHPQGETRGISLSPLYKSVPEIARHDEPLYRVLALVDALRIGRARDRKLAGQLLGEALRGA